MFDLARGRYRLRVAQDASDMSAAQRLRGLCFTPADGGPDSDDLDPVFTHVLIEDRFDGDLAACFRLLPMKNGREIERGYAARHYDLSRLSRYRRGMAELGRFCVRPGLNDPDILRIAWGALADFVDETGVGMLFGCTSFAGTDPASYHEAFALLRDRHLAPARWAPGVRAPEVIRYAREPVPAADAAHTAAMPAVLRTYLLMGGWVSDHAVVDRQLGTLHVFTGMEIRAIPDARKRALRVLAA